MSRSGVLSDRGDYYQILVAEHWLIRLLRNPTEIIFVQVESTGIPREPDRVTVDDVVIRFADGRTRYIQAKKNQPYFRAWSLPELKEELLKALVQLEQSPSAEVEFVSRSTFGDLQKLSEECSIYPDHAQFTLQASASQKALLEQFSTILGRPMESGFLLAKRFHFGPTDDYEEWESRNLADLKLIVPRADTAIAMLDSLLLRHQSKVGTAKIVISYDDIKKELAKHSLDPVPFRSEADLLLTFRQSSAIGRKWQRDIAGEALVRSYTDEALTAITAGKKTILVKGGPGSGKTCVLLDIVDAIEQRSELALLFVKADLFKSATTEEELAAAGLPIDIVGQCARLSEYRHVVVVMDSLDVLSLTRHHHSLQLFLRLLDRLEKLENTSIVAACRDFDLKYDPLLRVRSWDQTVEVGLLDFDSQVSPILESCDLSSAGVPVSTRELLRVPNHLKLYTTLILRRGIHLSASSVFDLFELFIEELILKNDELGPPAIEALYDMAAFQLKERTTGMPSARFPVPGAIKSLMSLGVLMEPMVGRLYFGHQTWGEALSVRKALSTGQTMRAFIKAHKPFPFIRPAVRAFFLYLRAQQSDTFRREVRAVLSDTEIAYHLKRLIAESLAEIVPDVDDWTLIRHLIDDHADLFRRFVWRIESAEWFSFLRIRWLPQTFERAENDEANEELHVFLARLSQWMNDFPEEVIAIWRRALRNEALATRNLRWQVIAALKEFEKWASPGVRDLLTELLHAHNGKDRDFLGYGISRFVQATNTGDDLLWDWITCDFITPKSPGFGHRVELHCLPHELCSESFLADRVFSSERLLDLILTSVSKWSQEISSGFSAQTRILFNAFLHDTSWEINHADRSRRPPDGGTLLFNAVEASLRRHAVANSAWWRRHVEDLRCSPELALRYLHIQACIHNITDNSDSIAAVLVDRELLDCGELDYELGQLLNAACPYLPLEVVQENQRIILLPCFDDVSNSPRTLQSAIRRACKWLNWIPCCYRVPDGQELLERNISPLFPLDRKPTLYMTSGVVQPPFSAEELLSFSDTGILKLFNHYSGPSENDEYEFSTLMGGKTSVLQQVQNAASLHPTRMLALLSTIVTEVPDVTFAEHTLTGLAYHIEYRNGRLSNPQHRITLSTPDLTELARSLLLSLGQLPTEQYNKRDVVEVLLACAQTILDPSDTALLTDLLFDAIKRDDSQDEINENAELIGIAINSIQGRAAEAALVLCNRLLEESRPLPERLPLLLQQLSTGANVAVRALILTHLAYTQTKAPELGWSLFRAALLSCDARLLAHTERCLYHQYHDHYDRITPWLERMEVETSGAADACWARIVTLACLSKHIDFLTLVTKLEKRQSTKAWQGAAQVFTANLERPETNAICQKGLLYLLQTLPPNVEILGVIERMFHDVKYPRITHEIARAYLDVLERVEGHCDLHGFLQWLEFAAQDDPRAAMESAEAMMHLLNNRRNSHQIWNKEPLLAALTMMLREADESDDGAFIIRAIALQDHLLGLDVYGLQELYDVASRA